MQGAAVGGYANSHLGRRKVIILAAAILYVLPVTAKQEYTYPQVRTCSVVGSVVIAAAETWVAVVVGRLITGISTGRRSR